MLVGTTLKDVVNENNCMDTAEVLYLMDNRIAKVLNVEKAAWKGNRNCPADIDDGCDMAALFIGKDGSVSISNGNIHVFICGGKEARRLKGQKLRIGEGRIKGKEDFLTVTVPADKENKYYISSDGLYDQMGGDPLRPFGFKVIQKIMLEYHQEPQSVISEKIWDAFESYRGNQVRRDDVELISFRAQGGYGCGRFI